MRVLLLSRYADLGASSRLRSYQYLQPLKSFGVDVEVSPLFSNKYLSMKYEGGFPVCEAVRAYASRLSALVRSRNYNLIWLEKEFLPWLPSWFELSLLPHSVPYVVDYDDAIFHRYDRSGVALVRGVLGGKIDAVMRKAALVITGNSYLFQRAKKAGARRAINIPTVVDLQRYSIQSKKTDNPEVLKLVWIGTKYTAKYLDILRVPLAEAIPNCKIELHVVGASGVTFPGVDVKCIPWAEATEVGLIHDCDVGIMPLIDSDWERGKCGYKLIQYMACRLPVVASPVGANVDIVQEGVSGFLANSTCGWRTAFLRFAGNRKLRDAMGDNGRETVEKKFSVQAWAPRLAEALKTAAKA